MKKIKSKKIKPNINQNTTIPNHNSLKLSYLNGACGFFFFFVFFFLFLFLFLFLPQISFSVSQFLRLHSFLFFFLPSSFLLSPSILVLSFLELSLSLDFAQTQTQTQMPQAPLSNQLVSLFGIFFCCGFLCIWCCQLAMVRWRACVCGDRRGGGLSLLIDDRCKTASAQYHSFLVKWWEEYRPQGLVTYFWQIPKLC